LAGSTKRGTRHGVTYCFINPTHLRLAGHATSQKTDSKHLKAGVYVNAGAAHIISKPTHSCIPAQRPRRPPSLQQSTPREPHERGPAPCRANDVNRCIVTDDGLISAVLSSALTL